MTRKLAFAVSALLLAAAPAWASSFKIFEESLGSPGVTAQFPTGNGLVADIDFDASSAEGGSLLFGASEIHIVPLGDAILTAFSCELAGCTEGVDYTFTAGGTGTGSILITDSNVNSETGVRELGLITWNSASSGSLYLAGCNYTDASATERTCDPFTLAQTVPEPANGPMLALALIGFGFARRWRTPINSAARSRTPQRVREMAVRPTTRSGTPWGPWPR